MTETAAAAVEIAPANTSSSNCSSSSSVQQVAPPRLDTISFAVSLPAAVWSSWDEPETTRSLPGDERGIVGTIVFMKKSVMIWFGWGQLVPEVAGTTTTTTTDDTAGATDDAIPTSSMTTRAVGRGTFIVKLSSFQYVCTARTAGGVEQGPAGLCSTIRY